MPRVFTTPLCFLSTCVTPAGSITLRKAIVVVHGHLRDGELTFLSAALIVDGAWGREGESGDSLLPLLVEG